MTCLLSILAGVEKSGDEELLQVVTTLYTETVLAFRRKLPPAMQLVDLLVEFEAEADRAKVMEAAVRKRLSPCAHQARSRRSAVAAILNHETPLAGSIVPMKICANGFWIPWILTFSWLQEVIPCLKPVV